jgi:methylenetetrahydrofolate dehydrogenase (NADP+)/methenyltetrahydrofolate cyclohydrolase
MIIFDGKLHAAILDEKIVNSSSVYKQKILAIVQVGDNPSSEKYIKVKQTACEKLGVTSRVYRILPKRGSGYNELVDLLKTLGKEDSVSSIIVQLPLPDSSMYSSLDLLPLEKDIDFLSPAKKSTPFDDALDGFATKSPVIRALEYYLGSNGINTDTTNRVGIIGQGDLVGKPCHDYLTYRKFNTTIIENYTVGDQLNFDLLILSTGVPKLINPNDIQTGCHVVDFGSAVVNEKTVGDLNTDYDCSHLGIVSKSPGGMGPLVVRFLLMNHLHI